MREFLLRLVMLSVVTIVADRAEAQHSRINFSVGGNLAAGDVKYDGDSAVLNMIRFREGVLTAFSNCAGNPRQAACVHWSENGQQLGGGPRVYEGSSPVTAMIAYKDGVLTAFSNCGGGQPACIHWSENGKQLGGGPRVYEGTSLVTAMIAHKDGVLTAFSNCSGDPRQRA